MLLAHLAAKAIHLPGRARLLREAGERFLAAYESAVDQPTAVSHLGWHTAAILLARVDGRSPVGYFTEPERNRARVIARLVLGLPDAGIADLWDPITEEAP